MLEWIEKLFTAKVEPEQQPEQQPEAKVIKFGEQSISKMYDIKRIDISIYMKNDEILDTFVDGSICMQYGDAYDLYTGECLSNGFYNYAGRKVANNTYIQVYEPSIENFSLNKLTLVFESKGKTIQVHTNDVQKVIYSKPYIIRQEVGTHIKIKPIEDIEL